MITRKAQRKAKGKIASAEVFGLARRERVARHGFDHRLERASARTLHLPVCMLPPREPPRPPPAEDHVINARADHLRRPGKQLPPRVELVAPDRQLHAQRVRRRRAAADRQVAALAAASGHARRLQRHALIATPLVLLAVVAMALAPLARPVATELNSRALAAAQLWKVDPALAVQALRTGLHDRVWQPLAMADGLGRFERDTQLLTTVASPRFAVDVRDAVREVFLTRSRLQPALAVTLADTLVEEANRFGYDPFLVLAIIEVESNFDHAAVSYRGARGLMQLMPDTRAWMLSREATIEQRDSRPYEADIRVGVRYLALLHRVFGRLDRALQAYNCGPGRLVEAMHETAPLPLETKFYAERVMKRFQRFKRDYAHLSKSPA